MNNISRYKRGKLNVIVLSVAILFSGCETEEEAAKNHLQRGKELLEKGDYAAAQLELKTAKQGNKSTGETYYYLALLDEKVRNYHAMQDNLQKTLKLEPDHRQAHLKLGKLKLLMGEVDKAQAHINILLTKNPQDIEALILKASILLREKKQDDALAIINSILETSPTQVDALTLKAMVLMQQDQKMAALALINKAIAIDEKNVSLHLFKIQIHAKQNAVDKVINDYLTLIELFPENDAYQVTLAKVYSKSGKFDQAEALLRDLVVKKPNDIKAKILVLEFLSATDNEQVAGQITEFSNQLKNQPKQLFELSQWLLAKGNVVRAKELLNKIITLDKNSEIDIKANILLAKLAFDAGDYAQVKKISVDILAESPDQVDAKLLEARLLLVKEKYAQAHAYLDKLMWSHPKSDEALVLLAQVYLVEGDRQKAENKFKEALKINPANVLAFRYEFNRLIGHQEPKYARKLLQKALRKDPRNSVLLQKLVQLNLQEKKWDEAKKAITQLSSLVKGKNIAIFYQADVFQGQGEYQKAIDIYKQLLVKFPEQKRVLLSMSRSYERLNQRSKMVAFLQAQLKENKDNMTASLLLAELYAMDKKYKKSISLLNDLKKSHPKLAIIASDLAKVYLAKGQVSRAIAVYEQALKVHQGNIRLSLSLASLYEQRKEYAKAVTLYEQLIKDKPDLNIAINNLATLLVDHFSSLENNKRALQLVENFAKSEQPYYLDTYAWTLLNNDNKKEALKRLKDLINKAPNHPIFRYHLAVAEYKSGNNSAALVQLSEAINMAKKGANFPERELAEQMQKEIINKMRNH